MTIQQLPPLLIDQIAAGEVVERPASVVKELVENAIDAGASRIELILHGGGLESIEVRDDGLGIPAEELELAVTSHATSKIVGVDDLQAIASLGFRGEALASIAAVSRLTLTSRPRGGEGASLSVEFGKLGPVKAAPAPEGTRIEVRDLFRNLPARLKFMKRESTERAHCLAWVERLAISHTGIGFRARAGDRVLLDVAPQDGIRDRVAAVLGQGLSDGMHHIEADLERLRLDAWIGPPDSARRDARQVHTYLNGRWVRDPRLMRAAREGVREFVPHGFYPSLVLQLTLDPVLVDVNVHPQKTEVRFRDDRFVVGSIIRTLAGGLAQSAWATGAERVFAGAASDRVAERAPAARKTAPSGDWSPQQRTDSPSLLAESAPLGLSEQAKPLDEGEILRVANTYLVREVPGGMELIDQHALHERVNLEELRREAAAGQVTVQPLLVPELLELSREDIALLAEEAPRLTGFGVDLEPFGETTLSVRGVPARLDRLRAADLIEELLELLRRPGSAAPEDLGDALLQRMSCRGAVMAGDHLSTEMLQDLLKRGAELPQDRTCAHGRPVRVFLSLEDLERAFYRR